MRLRSALDLRDLRERLVAHAQLRVAAIHRTAVELRALEHAAVAAVRVVRDRERFDALLALPVHPAPQLFRILRFERGERQVRRARAGEDHVAMQVLAVRRGGELVAAEGRELARHVVAIGGFDDRAPRRACGVRVLELRQVLPGAQARADPLKRRVDLLAVGAEQIGRVGNLRERMLRVVHRRQDAEILRVIRDREEIERRVGQPHVVAGGVVDRLALRVAVRVVRRGAHVEDVSVEGQLRVHVQVAEVRVAIAVLRGRAGCEQHSDECAGQQRVVFLHRFLRNSAINRSQCRSAPAC